MNQADTDEESCGGEPAGGGVQWGPEYTSSNALFFERATETNPFYYDEVYAFLVSEVEERQCVYPCRLKGRQKQTRILAEFRKNLRKTWRVQVNVHLSEKYVLFHEVKGGKHGGITGDRRNTTGWKIVPPKSVALSLVVTMHGQFHYGRDRALEKLNTRYIIPNKQCAKLLTRAKDQCGSCLFKTESPKNPPATPITSRIFGERILMDLKTLKIGFMIVVVDHWSNYCWLGHLRDKKATGVQEFLSDSVFPDVDEIKDSWKKTHEESKEVRIGGISFPVNFGELQIEVPDSDIHIGVFAGDETAGIVLDELIKSLETRHRVLQHDRCREFNNALVKDLRKDKGRTICMSKEYSPRENGKVESKVKYAHMSYLTEVDKFTGDERSSVEERKMAIASAQAIENHAMHAKSRVSPYEAAHHRKAIPVLAPNGMTSVGPGRALDILAVLTMIRQITFRQYRTAHALVLKFEALTRDQVARSKQLKVGQEVTFRQRKESNRARNKGFMCGKITRPKYDEGKDTPTSVHVKTVEGNTSKAWGMKPSEIRMPPPLDYEIQSTMDEYTNQAHRPGGW